MKAKLLGAALLLTAAGMAGPAVARDYNPDVIELDGTQSLAFPPSPQINLSKGGAIEFWVAPNWKGELPYDPPVVVDIGPKGISYLISVMRGRDGIVFANADDEADFLTDLTDGQLHHVTFNIMDDGIVAYVDGQVVGTSNIRPLALPSSGLFVGGLDLEGATRFTGAVGQLRIWGEPLSEEDIKAYRLSDVLNPDGEDHPDIDNLKAMSDFTKKQLLLVDNVEDLP